MNEIKCPHCQTLFSINDTEYHQLLEQVRTKEFEHDLLERLSSERKLLEEQSKNELQLQLGQKDEVITTLQHQLDSFEQQEALKVQTLQSERDKDVQELKQQLDKLASEHALSLAQALASKESENQKLSAELQQVTLQKDNEKQEALALLQQEKDQLRNQLLLQEQKQELDKQALLSQFQTELAQKDELLAYYKDFKAKQSTKMIGESLEQHCEYEFNRLRMTAFPKAQFGKDNDATSGSKGDYIYREYDENGIEIISIMFEMKNEADETSTKKKNEHFFKELDKDRREKRCEYAVLVSLLEMDNELYNNGIVDVSYAYPKMYVVRPQFFIPIITLLRNAALNSLHYKQELALVKEQHIDITHFEEDLNTFKNAFAKNYQSASKNFKKAIDEIDKAIKRMEAVKAALTTSENQLRLANNKLDDVSVKKLTRKNPTMRSQFEALDS
ncbi:Serine/threonine-protein kinase MRCK beta [Streptococcus acidominimus]|uniref:Serine/threonine-protein kinase MRCK beta n=1 Tax=Streptococcus acidominimus TaxID=1326 RepID=A0A239X1G3_STRAI|nr:DUF2130 domain-containing protein [Streptococcus acidominimus]SNV40379.1 Serine/threonine-protein kinase MRCK beta [Streptococcus acidominimus]